MTPARTVAPNHGGRANTRGRAVVASFNAVSNVQRTRHGRGWQPIHAGCCRCDTYTRIAGPDRQSDCRNQKPLPARVVGNDCTFPAVLHSRAGFRAVSTGGASFFATP